MNSEYKIKNYKVQTAKIWQTLILHNCLPLGKQAKFTSKNVAQYLLGSRNDYNLFKFNEIKHLLLKFTPLIETLFKTKLVLKTKIGFVNKTRFGKPTPPKDPTKYHEWYAKMKNIKIAKYNTMFFYKTVENKRPIKILFASTNPIYRDIIKKSAENCQMTAHTNRWLCGYITANSKTLGKKIKINKQLNNFSSNSQIERQFEKVFKANKETKELRYQWHNYNLLTQRPALAIIPDIINNDMILRETLTKNIPVIGLVNSYESTKIAYPIFGNSDSIQTVHFFCHFLSLLIAKAFIQQEYKQSSHRILNRTRAFFGIKSKNRKISSVTTYSKKQIIIKTKIFPILKKGYKKPKLNPLYPINITQKWVTKNFTNVARYKLNKRIYKLNKNIKKRQVGKKPYWKNLYMMILTLRIKLKNLKKLKNNFKINQKISTKFITQKFNIKKQYRNIKRSQRIDQFLLNKFNKKLYQINKFNESNTKNLKLALKKDTWKYWNTLKLAEYKLDLIQKKNENIRKNYLRPRDSKLLKRKWLQSKKTIRKYIIKGFGHQGIIRKNKRSATQFSIKKLHYSKKLPKYKQKIVRNLLKLKNLIQFNHIGINSNQLQNLTKIYTKLLWHKRNINKEYTVKKAKIFLKKIWRNKQLLTTLLKKYPYFTFVTKNLIFDKNPSLNKNTYKILSSEWNNYKKNPYTFSMKQFTRQRIITNDIMWQQLYFNTLIIKYQKKRFKQKAKTFWLKSKVKFRGDVSLNLRHKFYYFKKLTHLKNKKSFPKFISKIKKSFRSTERKKHKKLFKLLFVNLWWKRKFKLKFLRSHAYIPKLANIIMPYRSNYKRFSQKKKKNYNHKLNNQFSRKNWKIQNKTILTEYKKIIPNIKPKLNNLSYSKNTDHNKKQNLKFDDIKIKSLTKTTKISKK